MPAWAHGGGAAGAQALNSLLHPRCGSCRLLSASLAPINSWVWWGGNLPCPSSKAPCLACQRPPGCDPGCADQSSGRAARQPSGMWSGAHTAAGRTSNDAALLMLCSSVKGTINASGRAHLADYQASCSPAYYTLLPGRRTFPPSAVAVNILSWAHKLQLRLPRAESIISAVQPPPPPLAQGADLRSTWFVLAGPVASSRLQAAVFGRGLACAYGQCCAPIKQPTRGNSLRSQEALAVVSFAPPAAQRRALRGAACAALASHSIASAGGQGCNSARPARTCAALAASDTKYCGPSRC